MILPTAQQFIDACGKPRASGDDPVRNANNINILK